MLGKIALTGVIVMRNFADSLAFSGVSGVHCSAGGPDDRYPRLHEQQLLEHQRWHALRQQRVMEHADRVAAHLKRFSRAPRNAGATMGKRRATWCVEMKQRFESVSAAGRFVDRPPSNILQAIHSHNRCGSYHWEYFDAARHGSVAAEDARVESCCGNRALLVHS